MLYGLQDVNHNLVALADGQGRPALQYSYTPYGTVQAIDEFQPGTYPATLNAIGHQGLFFDNLVEPWVAGLVEHRPEGAVTWEAPTPPNPNPKQITDLRKLAWGMYQNRNRTYMPTLGRFLQRDPNASGQPLSGWFDSGMSPVGLFIDPPMSHVLGGSLHTYLGGMPLSGTDPSGLFEFNLGSLMGNIFPRQALASGGVGAAWGGIFGGASQAGKEGWAVAKGATIGAVSGFAGGVVGYHAAAAQLFGSGISLGNLVFGGSAGGAVGSAADSAMNLRSPGEIATDALKGAVLGAIGGLIGGVAYAKFVSETGDSRAFGDLLDDIFGEGWDVVGGSFGGFVGSATNELW